MTGIAGTAYVDPGAVLGDGVAVGHGTFIGPGVRLGRKVDIGPLCVLGADGCGELTIGDGSIVRSHAVIYAGTEMGAGFQTGHHVIVRSGCTIGVNVSLGSHSTIEEDVRVGDYSRLHGYVHVGTGTTIGSFCWVFSLVTFTTDPMPPSHVRLPVTVEDGAVLAVGVTPMPGTTVGEGAFVSSGATIHGDVPPATFVLPNGAIGGPITRLMSPQHGIRHPWMRHYADTYPATAQSQIEALLERVTARAKKWTA